MGCQLGAPQAPGTGWSRVQPERDKVWPPCQMGAWGLSHDVTGRGRCLALGLPGNHRNRPVAVLSPGKLLL